MNALARIYAIANSRRGDQRADVRTLIDGYTRQSAYVMFADDERGTLAPGQLADLAILSRDIIALPPRTAADLAVDVTLFDGKVVYERRPSP
jgi:hypothetical protein